MRGEDTGDRLQDSSKTYTVVRGEDTVDKVELEDKLDVADDGGRASQRLTVL